MAILRFYSFFLILATYTNRSVYFGQRRISKSRAGGVVAVPALDTQLSTEEKNQIGQWTEIRYLRDSMASRCAGARAVIPEYYCWQNAG